MPYQGHVCHIINESQDSVLPLAECYRKGGNRFNIKINERYMMWTQLIVFCVSLLVGWPTISINFVHYLSPIVVAKSSFSFWLLRFTWAFTNESFRAGWKAIFGTFRYILTLEAQPYPLSCTYQVPLWSCLYTPGFADYLYIQEPMSALGQFMGSWFAIGKKRACVTPYPCLPFHIECASESGIEILAGSLKADMPAPIATMVVLT